jgi:hypothetical protein
LDGVNSRLSSSETRFGLALCRHDPVARFLARRTGGNVFLLGVVAFLLNAIFGVTLGIVISLRFQSLGANIISLVQYPELPITVFNYLIVSPTVWAFYLWQPGAILAVFSRLIGNGVVAGGDPGKDLGSAIEDKLDRDFNRPAYPILALGSTLAALVLWLAYLAVDPFGLGLTRLWWHVQPLYFWPIWLPLVFVNVYLGIWAIIRQIVAVRSFRWLCEDYVIVPRPRHPDGCNGLGPVGGYALRSGLVAVIFGFWVFLMASFAEIFDRPANLEVLTVFLLLTYVSVVAVLLLPPAWAVHQAMERAKAAELERLAAPMRALLADADPQHATATVEQFRQLEAKYQIVDREYRVWPFRPIEIRGFGIAALTPVLTPVLSALGALLSDLLHAGLGSR